MPNETPLTTKERDVPMLVAPVEQCWHVTEEMFGSVRIATLTVQVPWCTLQFPMTEEIAVGLADALRDVFAGKLTIASAIPNGGA